MPRLLILTLMLCVISIPLGAQTTSGSIVGTISDPSGGVIAGASVTITNMDTGIAVKTTSDNAGNYVVTPLQVGVHLLRQ